MKLLLLASPLLVAVTLARGAALGRVRGNAEENRSRKMSTQRRAKSSSGKGGIFSTGKGKGSGIFHSKSSKSQYSGVFLGDLITDPADASDTCKDSLTNLYATTSTVLPSNSFGCSHNGLSTCDTTYTSDADMCLAGADTAGCYDIDGNEVTVQVKAAWDWSNYAPPYCATVLPYSVAPSVILESGDTAGLCYPFPVPEGCTGLACLTYVNFSPSASPPYLTLDVTDPWPTIDSTVTITLDSGTGTSYTGSILPGGTVCEIHDATGYTGVNKSKIFFEITIEGQDYKGIIEVDVVQSVPFPIDPLSPNLVLWQV